MTTSLPQSPRLRAAILGGATCAALVFGLPGRFGSSALREAAAQEAEGSKDAEGKLTFRFQRASIQAFLGYLSREAGFSFIEEASVQGDITAIAEKPLSPNEALSVLRAWLLPKDRTLLQAGKVIRIVTLEEAKRRGLPVKIGSKPEEIADTNELVTQVMPLRYVTASEVKDQLSELLSQEGKLMIESASNSLVVRDTSSVIRRFAEVLAALDQAVTAELSVKVYRLQNGDSAEVVKVIQELFQNNAASAAAGGGGGGGGGGGRGGRGGRGGGGGGGMRQMAQMFFQRGGGGAAAGGGAAGGARVTPVQVTNDSRTNSVVITASKDQIVLIDQLVKELDKDPDSIVTEIRSYPLQNADATNLASTLTSLFEEQQQTQQNNGRGGRGGGGGNNGVPRWVQRMIPGAGGDEGTGTSQRDAPTPRFTVDQRTNTLIVSASSVDQGVIGKVITDLDKDPTEQSGVLVIPLRHGEAANLATILNTSLSENGSTGTTTNANNRNNRNNRNAPQANSSSSTSSFGGLVGEVTVVADETANSLVFTSAPRNFDRIRAIVGQLDKARREVFIECLIAEVTLTDRSELGIQWNTAFTNSLDNKENGTQSLGTDFGLDALADGLRYTTTSDKFSGLLRALATEGRLNILSSPKILVLENADAEISVGQEVPFVTNSRITNNGDTVNTIQYRDVGIILRVTPQVNDDGFVRMTVHPEVSSIAPDSESVPISDGVRSPTFNKNFADTSIVIGSGETAIIGGLIRDSLSESKFKIPFLGDIPILGHVFSSTSKELVKQEIVVFLTPHVVEHAGELRAQTEKTLAEYANVPTEILESNLTRWLKGLEEETHAYHYNRGTVLLESGRVDQAIRDLRKAKKLRPDEAATLFNLGLAYARSGELAKAEEELRQAELLDPTDPEIPYNMACVLWRRKDYPRAQLKLKRTLGLAPNHEGAQVWLPKAAQRVAQIEAEVLGEQKK